MENSSASSASRDLSADVLFALDTLVRVVERQSGAFQATILILSDDGQHLLDGAGPSIPADYRRAIHGQRIGPVAGSCGTAAYWNERVIVEDIETSPLWEQYRDLARQHNFAACWSQPIRSRTGEVLGTFAMYYMVPRRPSRLDIEVIEAAAGRAGALLEEARAGADRYQLVANLV